MPPEVEKPLARKFSLLTRLSRHSFSFLGSVNWYSDDLTTVFCRAFLYPGDVSPVAASGTPLAKDKDERLAAEVDDPPGTDQGKRK